MRVRSTFVPGKSTCVHLHAHSASTRLRSSILILMRLCALLSVGRLVPLGLMICGVGVGVGVSVRVHASPAIRAPRCSHCLAAEGQAPPSNYKGVPNNTTTRARLTSRSSASTKSLKFSNGSSLV